jgi:hypothetical protein
MTNSFNASTVADLKATTIGVDYSLIPHTLHVGLAYRAGKTAGAAASAGSTTNVGSFDPGTGLPIVTTTTAGATAEVASKTDNAVTVTAVYDLFQNVALHANYSKYSGSAYDGAGVSNSLLTMMLESAW